MGKKDEEADPALDAAPIQQDEREHALDGNVIDAGVTQDTLADLLAQDVKFLHEQDEDRQSGDGAGHPDAEDELPDVAGGPIQPPLNASMSAAAPQPKSSGTPSARPAVMLVSARCRHALCKSSSMPATQTKIITAHCAMPLS